jgi:hypothetical protein
MPVDYQVVEFLLQTYNGSPSSNASRRDRDLYTAKLGGCGTLILQVVLAEGIFSGQ